MNNEQGTFNPEVNQPVNQNLNGINNIPIENNQNIVQQPTPTMPQMQPVDITNNTNPTDIQQQMNTIPTVDQDKQNFMTNTQAANEVKNEEKKKGPNIALIVIIFAIIFASIFFLFPYLLDVLG